LGGKGKETAAFFNIHHRLRKPSPRSAENKKKKVRALRPVKEKGGKLEKGGLGGRGGGWGQGGWWGGGLQKKKKKKNYWGDLRCTANREKKETDGHFFQNGESAGRKKRKRLEKKRLIGRGERVEVP